ncbi:MAG: transposase, partial [Proteobacteria bacterium]|nr:transposase [Pseudomonadota bacterium]
LREAWRELLFADTDQAAKETRDPVAPAQRSAAALRKVSTGKLEDGTAAHSFATLMDELSTIVRNTCRTPHAGPEAHTFEVVTTANPKQRRALELIKNIQV